MTNEWSRKILLQTWRWHPDPLSISLKGNFSSTFGLLHSSSSDAMVSNPVPNSSSVRFDSKSVWMYQVRQTLTQIQTLAAKKFQGCSFHLSNVSNHKENEWREGWVSQSRVYGDQHNETSWRRWAWPWKCVRFVLKGKRLEKRIPGWRRGKMSRG